MGLFGKKKDDKNTSRNDSITSTTAANQDTNPDLVLLQMTETVKTNKNKLASNANTVVQAKKTDSVFFEKLPKNPFKGI
ncbi:MAG TPA: hypothetical protein PK957_01095 [Candidatus Dojkabacteria bacterium]|nr:hypothetical protein [Candidatus Dojkabacteria bacterium]HQF36212.1 hypothetical protein [Candidatus Dojkabacteria bacterium]